MTVGLRNVDGKINGILDTIVAVVGQAHQVCAAAADFDHVADHLLVQLFLGQHTDNQRPIFNQADGTMFQLTRRVCFRMDIADLLHLEGPFQTDRVIQSASDKEDIMRIGKLCRKPLNPFLVIQYPFDLIRQRLQFLNQRGILCIVNRLACLRKLN